MGIPVIVYGKSGAGKTYSLKGFGRSELALMNVTGKPLSYKGGFDINVKPKDADELIRCIGKAARNGYKAICIDDAGYLMTKKFMDGHRSKKGGSSYELFNDIGDEMYRLITAIQDDAPADVIVYIVMHEMTNDMGECKVRTIGKLLDEKVCLEGLCTICIHCIVDNKAHLFRVQACDNDIAKSPDGMFEGDTIPNDLKAVDTAIREYYNMKEVHTNDSAI